MKMRCRVFSERGGVVPFLKEAMQCLFIERRYILLGGRGLAGPPAPHHRMPSSAREATGGGGQDKGGPQGTRQRGSASKNERRAIGIRAGRRGPQTLWPSELSAGALDESDDSPMSVQFPTKLQAPHLPSSSAKEQPKQSLPPPPFPGCPFCQEGGGGGGERKGGGGDGEGSGCC